MGVSVSPRDLKQLGAFPTTPAAATPEAREFDVRDLYAGPASVDGAVARVAAVPLDEKLREAYFWIVNNAIITPYYDMEFNRESPRVFRFGGVGSDLRLPTDMSFSSFVLLPLLNFVARRRALFIGGPGRGKTASAILMGVLAGYRVDEIRRSIQHGQPQMTIADLLGNPLPKDLVQADDMESIKIAWRRWISMRLKIVDEYNRIPTRTQSALLTLMADGYAEILGQVVESPESAWFLTANDDMGGGTYQVIEALKDRIDIVVKALNFNSRFLDELLRRVEDRVKPELSVPPEIIFTEGELDQAYAQVLKVPIPIDVRRRLEFFAAQFDFCDLAAQELEYKSKDTIRLSGKTLSAMCAGDCGRDKVKCLCSQTENGLSVRALMTVLHFAKTLAWFRGEKAVSLQDLRQILPWCLHEKLVPNPTSPFFDQPSSAIYRVDRVAWLRKAFDLACEEYVRLNLEKEDPVLELEEAFNRGLAGVNAAEVKKALNNIESHLSRLAKGTKLYAHVHTDVLKLKYFHQRYSNYLRWLKWRG
jgi:MoxR-like ATPase